MAQPSGLAMGVKVRHRKSRVRNCWGGVRATNRLDRASEISPTVWGSVAVSKSVQNPCPGAPEAVMVNVVPNPAIVCAPTGPLCRAPLPAVSGFFQG